MTTKDQPTTETTHACPTEGSGITPCCSKTPFELPSTDRMTLHTYLVTCHSTPVVINELLTSLEHEAIEQAGTLWGLLCQIVAIGPTREADLTELVVHVHAIQHAVMAQAAAREYPTRYRLAGSTIPRVNQ